MRHMVMNEITNLANGIWDTCRVQAMLKTENGSTMRG